MDRPLSRLAHERACRSIPGGVSSPVRSFDAVDAPPLVVERGEGAYLHDVDGRRYVDLLMCWGALVHGHAHPAVREAVVKAAGGGTGYGLSCRAEAELAGLIEDAFPSIDLLRLVNSGTEAVMSAVRLARGFTGRAKVIVFEGCYHGHSDGLLAQGGSGLSTLSIPKSAGVPESVVRDTLIARYNDTDSVRELAESAGGDLAAVLVEPVAGNMGVVGPEPGFLDGLRSICDETGAMLIFDEVITGFRVAPGGAQERFGVRSDLTTLGKIIGGGLPVGAFGGRREIMERLAPLGDVYQAGTLSGNPLVAAAGVAALRELRKGNRHEELERLAGLLADGLEHAAADAGVPLQVNRCGSMLTCFFADAPVTGYASSKAADGSRYAAFFRAMIERGVLLPPSPFESCFVSTVHTDEEVEAVTSAAGGAFAAFH
ncbi:MAG: glutamate-1-semialdehyde 2,1-aminomutase [bacterium]